MTWVRSDPSAPDGSLDGAEDCGAVHAHVTGERVEARVAAPIALFPAPKLGVAPARVRVVQWAKLRLA